jgi:tripartite-type tricarboxylate transporter receptor subunit TctC
MTSKKSRGRIAAGLAVLTGAALALTGCNSTISGAGGDGEEYYAGKTITLLVPFAPGGGADTTARLFAPLLEEYIPGNPTVIVENRGGGGSITGTNYFANEAPHDGTTILISSGSTHSAFALGDPNIDFDFADFTPVLGLPFGGALYVSADTGIVEPEDIVGPVKKPLVFAGENPSGGDLRRLLALDLLGVQYEAVFGYEGAGDSSLAFDRGEATISTDSILPYQQQVVPEIEAGKVVPIMSTGFIQNGEMVRVPALPDLMTPAELYTEITGKEASGPDWDALAMLTACGDSLSKAIWLHNDAPEEAIDAVAGAIQAMFDDPATAEKLADELAGNDPLFGDDLQTAIGAVTDPDPAAKKWLQDYLVERWDYEPFTS